MIVRKRRSPVAVVPAETVAVVRRRPRPVQLALPLEREGLAESTVQGGMLYLPTGKPAFVIDWGRPLSWKFSIYMVTSYLYYGLNRSVIPDHDYDKLCAELLAGWDTFHHPHKTESIKEQLTSTTGFAIRYPGMVVGAANHLLAHFRER